MFPDYKLLASFNLDEVGFIVILFMVAAALIPTAKAFDSYLLALVCMPFFVASAVACNMVAISMGLSFDFQEIYFERYVNLAVATGVGMSLVFLVIVGFVAMQQKASDLNNDGALGQAPPEPQLPVASKDMISALRKSR